MSLRKEGVQNRSGESHTLTVPLLTYDRLKLEPFPSMSREEVVVLHGALSLWRMSVDLDGGPGQRARDQVLYKILAQLTIGASP